MICWGHEWEDPTVTYNPPTEVVSRITSLPTISAQDTRKILYGFTTLVQRCKNCGDLHTYTVEGKASLNRKD